MRVQSTTWLHLVYIYKWDCQKPTLLVFRLYMYVRCIRHYLARGMPSYMKEKRECLLHDGAPYSFYKYLH